MLGYLDSIKWDNVISSNKIFNAYISSLPQIRKYFLLMHDELDKIMGVFSPQYVNIPGLKEYNTKLSAGKKTLENIELLENNRCFVVMTGQQPGLLTGPLYTLYKAIHVVKLADYLSKKYKQNFIPIFWNAAEDNDWDEVNYICLYIQNEICKIKMKFLQDINVNNMSFFKVPVDTIDIPQLLHDIKISTPDTEFKEYYIKFVENINTYANNFSDIFSAFMLKIFEKYGLIIVNPYSREIKNIVKDILLEELKVPLLTNKLLNTAGEALIKDRYKPKLHKPVSRCNLFLEEDNIRDKLWFKDDIFWTSKRRYSLSELIDILDKAPERFTSDVVIRPILASFLFPVVIYIAGPGEIAYYAQLKGIYERYNLIMPVIIPRISLTLIEPKIENILSTYSIKPWQLYSPVEAIANNLIRNNHDGMVIDKLFVDTREKIINILEELSVTLAGYTGCSVHKMFENIKAKLEYELKRCQDKTFKELRKRDTVLLNRLQKARISIYPDNSLQERIINVSYFFVKYGMEFVHRLYDIFPLDYTRHHYIKIGG
jgi:bacillithiol biosynthesis cysteine-adding enzyme BshC